MPPFVTVLLLAVFALLAGATPPDAQAQQATPTQAAPQPSPRDRLTTVKAQVDRIEATLGQQTVDDAQLERLRADIEPARSSLTDLEGDVAGPRDASKTRLDKLGPAPKAGDPPESPEIAQARQREAAVFADLDGVAKDTQFQIVRLDQLSNDIVERIREAFTRQITERGPSILDPFFWSGVLGDLPRAGYSLAVIGSDASGYFGARVGPGSLALALGVIVAGAVVARFVRHRAARLRDRLAARQNAPKRLTASFDAMLDIVYGVLGWPMVAILPLVALQLADLVPRRILAGVGGSVCLALLIAMVFYSMGAGILARDRPSLRLLPLSDWAARRIQRRVGWLAVIIGVEVLVRGVGKAIYAPVSITVAVTAITALLYAVINLTLLMRLRQAPPTPGVPPEQDRNPLDILRPVFWLVCLAILAALCTGYIALAGYIAFYALVLVFTLSFGYVAIVLIDTAFAEGLGVEGPRGRAFANAAGVSTRSLNLWATVVSGVLRFLVIAAVLLVLASGLGFYSADLFSTVQRSFFGFQVGEITISPSSILLGVVLFVLVTIITRSIRNWIRGTLLPRTSLDAGLQNSIATIVGYGGGALAIGVFLSEIGLNLQNIALVAGALSVGIGFGLQSIVSNFVSGLILLAERPIRVGDIVNVGGEEGFVRRISVRATEIETYERATLIVPNSQLITGVVKNWVYGNTWSRVKISLRVGYDADLDAVRAAMRGAAEGDPRILPQPAPRVFLSNLGDASLEFELVVVIASVETTAAVKSDLQMRILKAFREAGIRVAAQIPAAPAPVVANIEEVLAALDARRETARPSPTEAPQS